MLKSIFAFLFLASFTYAAPVKLAGVFDSHAVQAMSRINYEIVSHKNEAQKLQAEGYTCQLVTGKYNCKKLENIDSLPEQVSLAFFNKAPKSISLVETNSEYSEDFQTDSLAEWTRSQLTIVDGLQFNSNVWREVAGVSRIIVKNENHTFEFLYNNGSLGSVERMNYTDPKTRKMAQYWAVVLFKQQ